MAVPCVVPASGVTWSGGAQRGRGNENPPPVGHPVGRRRRAQWARDPPPAPLGEWTPVRRPMFTQVGGPFVPPLSPGDQSPEAQLPLRQPPLGTPRHPASGDPNSRYRWAEVGTTLAGGRWRELCAGRASPPPASRGHSPLPAWPLLGQQVHRVSGREGPVSPALPDTRA